ncbi:argininosuccinate synthase domain-containing protein [Kutzneria sp. CA-103260]|uniref:argininosuccinate synthase domain-containing protein n=1 Tax=Kutzneria sp. CA-103260 TaxID=2802641 RepID=UPI001BACFDB4|nr:argininosuccinate synthase domain-containing protein [Kutzneria sp. CA-103260]QUQ72599.1 Argininosuccinate synthase [Kutzneria sp. CA-103260]
MNDADFCRRAVQANALVPAPVRIWCPTTAFVGSDADQVVITFDRGVPVAVDGETVTMLQAVQELNWRVGGSAQPGASTLITAHRQLEDRTVEPDLLRFKRRVERRWAKLVGNGGWSSSLRTALDAFIATSQEHVSGEVRLELRDRLTPAA